MATGANFAGDYEPQGAIVIQASKGTSAGITKGDIVALSSNKWITAATNDDGPFAMACETAAQATTTIKVLVFGIGYVTADGAINPNSRVQISASTAGQVIAAADASATQTTTTYFQRDVGMYLAHENEGDGSTEATAAADGDVIRVFIGKL